MEAPVSWSGNVWRRVGSCSSSTLHIFWSCVHSDFRFEVVIKICEDWKYEQDRTICHFHPLFCIACAEDEHIDNGWKKKGDEDCEGCKEGGLGHCQRIRWPTKLPQVFNTEAPPVDIQNIVVGMLGCWDEEDKVVHQTHYGHVQTVCMDQHLDINQSLCLQNAFAKPWLGLE